MTIAVIQNDVNVDSEHENKYKWMKIIYTSMSLRFSLNSAVIRDEF